MQDRSPLNDPLLEALAQQLALTTPRLEAPERDALLYACGFAAGRQSAVRVTRRWRAAAAGLALAAASLGVISTMSHRSPPVAEVARMTPRPREKPLDDRPFAVERRHELPRREGLLAKSSWEQVRASTSVAVQVLAAPEASPRRAVLSVGAAWNSPELSQ